MLLHLWLVSLDDELLLASIDSVVVVFIHTVSVRIGVV